MVRGEVRKRDAAPPAVGETLQSKITKMEHHFQLAMPRGFEATQLIRDALTCLRGNPKLAECEHLSVLGALMTCAQLGLRPGVPALGEAWLLPFWDNRSGGFKAQLIIGYQGYIQLGHRSGLLASLHARTVYENDIFDVEYGAAEDVWRHKPRWPRGKPIMFYAVGRTTNGGYAVTDPWTVEDMEEHRDRYAMARNKAREVVGPWADNFEQMAQKGLALDTPIPTPYGWSTMGDLREGDRVFDVAGEQVTVINKSEVKHIGCYRLTFANGDSIVCDDEHRWVARTGSNAARDDWRVMTIGDLFAAKSAGKSVVVPVAEELRIAEAALPVDPWLLGFWLGDGSGTTRPWGTHVSFAAHRETLAEIQQRINATTRYCVGGIWPDKRSNAVQFGVRGGLAKQLADLGVLGNKHVPAMYLRASRDQRLALLQGLIDSDGHVDLARGRVGFVNTNHQLADDFAELASSLGQVVHRHTQRAHGFGKYVTAYKVGFQPSIIPATLSAKVARLRPREIDPYRTVKTIEAVPSVPTQCIAVDSPTCTYLAGRTMVPTHNTMLLRVMKFLPKSTEQQRAIANDGAVRVDISPEAIDGTVDIEPEQEAPVTAEQILADEATATGEDQRAAAGTENTARQDHPVPPAPAAQDMTPDIADEKQDAPQVYEHDPKDTRQLFALLRKAGIDNTIRNKGRRLAVYRFITCRDGITSTDHLTPQELSAVVSTLYGWDKGRELVKKVDEILLSYVEDEQPQENTTEGNNGNE